MKSEKIHEKRNQQNIRAELVYLLYSQAKPAIIGSAIVSGCLVYVLYNIVPKEILLGWFGMMLAVCISRYALVKTYLKVRPVAERSYIWSDYFVVMAAFAGGTWSLAGCMLMPESSVYQIFIACALAGIASGAIPFFSGSRAACVAFVLPTLTPFTLWCFMQGDRPHELLGGMTLFYIALLLISGFRTHRVIYNAVKLKFENDELVTNLTLTQKEMVGVNKTLQTEVNDRKHAEKLLRESEEQYRLVTDALPVLISYIDNDLIYRFNNMAYGEWFDKPLTEITGKHVKDVLSLSAFALFAENYEKLTTNQPVNYETVMQFHEQDERYVSVSLIPHIKDNRTHGIFSLISDMTPRINYLATHDALTSLPNRSLFNARFSQAITRAQRHNTQVALLFLDLDNFKNINDTLGHDIGDMLLVQVAARMKNCIRDIDTLARFGGDEFTIVLEQANNEMIVNVAERICHAFKDPFQLDNQEVFTTTSIGISLYPDDGTEQQGLMRNADMAIYHAKEHGRNTFEFFTEELNKKTLRKAWLETNLRCAQENEEFEIYYQPVIDIPSNRITSLEALLRWDNSEMGRITPSEFIPVAEDSGLIVPIGAWVLRGVCEQNLRWQKESAFPVNLRISVNLSARQFREHKLIDMITSTLEETGLSGNHLMLEITESCIMHDVEQNIKVIKKLKDLGIQISIDDFGTGYSSLNYLRRFPIDTLKIDRSFITDNLNAEDDSDDAAKIVTAIIAMAHSLKMKVIAEGVETVQQYNFLREQGCDEIQGFLISKPVAVTEITTFLQRAFSYENYVKFRRFDKDYADKRWEESNSP